MMIKNILPSQNKTMNYKELINRLNTIDWFSKLGQFDGGKKAVPIPNLKPWDNKEFSPKLDINIRKIASDMDWLPSTKEQEDPINGDKLKTLLQDVPNGKTQVMEAYKVAMKSLRGFETEKLKSGSNDFSQVAKGAALYGVRMAAMESLVGKLGFWSEMIDYYSQGYWPCGLLSDGRVVVY